MPQLEFATFLLPQLSNSGIIDVHSPAPHRSSTVFPADVTQSFRVLYLVLQGSEGSSLAVGTRPVPLRPLHSPLEFQPPGICSHAHTDVLCCSVMGLLSLGPAPVWLPAVQGSSCLALAVFSIACQASEVPYFLWILETHRTSGLQSQAHFASHLLGVTSLSVSSVLHETSSDTILSDIVRLPLGTIFFETVTENKSGFC